MTLRAVFTKIARNGKLSFVCVMTAALLGRLAVMPWWGIPLPTMPDEFSYLLLADTFLEGRLANPPHPLWVHFETLFVNVQPTYSSVYPVAQGIFLALGRAIAAEPWYGVWVSCGLMCGCITWMLRGWFPPRWALYGGLFAAAQIAIYSYWNDSYWGGSPAAIGGALLFGALPRIRIRPRGREAILAALGAAVLIHSRPYEGLLLVLCGLFWAIVQWRAVKDKQGFTRRVLLPFAVAGIAAAGFTGYYFWRVTGSPFSTPYAPYIKTYAASPIFIWQKNPPIPEYRHSELREMHLSFRRDLDAYKSPGGILQEAATKIFRTASFYLGPVMILPVAAFPFLLRGRRIRFFLVSLIFLLAGLIVVVPFQPHYAAPGAAILVAIGVQSLRHLWVLQRWGNPVGRILTFAMPVVCIVTTAATYRREARVHLSHRPEIISQLKASPGDDLVFVRYGGVHLLTEEWVYNDAEIDGSEIVWARDMQEKNVELRQYYPSRVAWTLEADANPPQLLRMH